MIWPSIGRGRRMRRERQRPLAFLTMISRSPSSASRAPSVSTALETSPGAFTTAVATYVGLVAEDFVRIDVADRIADVHDREALIRAAPFRFRT